MENSLRDLLKRNGILPATVDVLEEEHILSLHTFHAIKEEHFGILLKQRLVSIGQHILLLEVWEGCTSGCTSKYDNYNDSNKLIVLSCINYS